MIQIENMEQEITEKIDAYIDYRDKAVHMIKQLPDPEEASILYQWYIKKKKPKEIAMQIDRSTSTVWAKYRSALDSFEKMYADVLND
ncbi:MAG: DUF1492 domain-containing protein [Lachnospiraceae bacterium]|nr:DUF1492 domain-containing protein [Lachnospiraceae bacterium]